MSSQSGIYTITSPSGKQYVGSAASIPARWRQHRRQLLKGSHHNRRLQASHDKYGASSLIFRVVAHCPKEDLLRLEQRFMDELRPAYNICPTAGSTLGVVLGPHSEEHRRRIGEGNKGKKLTIQQRVASSRTHRGKKLSKRHIEALREKSAGERNHFFGKTHSPDTIRKMSGDNHHSARAVICDETGERFPSIAAARDWLRATSNPSASSSPIMSCCKGSSRYSKAYGFTWRYERAWTRRVMRREDQLSMW